MTKTWEIIYLIISTSAIAALTALYVFIAENN